MNSRFDSLEKEIVNLKAEISQTKDELNKYEFIPDSSTLFQIANKNCFDPSFDKVLFSDKIPNLTDSRILELGSGIGQHAAALRRFQIRSYYGLEASHNFVTYSSLSVNDARFEFNLLNADTLQKVKSERYDLVIYAPSRKSFALEEFKKCIEISLSALADGGHLFLLSPYPITDLSDMDFNIINFLKSAGYKVTFDDNLIIANTEVISDVSVAG